MSWLSQGLQDIGLGGVNTFFNTAIKPALENPAVDLGLGLGAAALTGGLLAPEIGAGLTGLFGAGDAAATAAPAAAVGAPLDLGAFTTAGSAAAGAPLDLSAFTTAGGAGLAPAADAGTTALGFTGDVGAGAGDLSSFLANPATANALATPGGSAVPSLALSSVDAAPLSAVGTPLTDLSTPAVWSFPSDTSFGTSVLDTTEAGGLQNLTSADVNFLQNAGVNPDIATQALNAPPAPPNTFLGGLASKFTPAALGANIGGLATNPLSILGIGGLGYNLYQGYEQKQALNALQSQENQQAQLAAQNAATATAAVQPALSQGELLQTYLTTGQLPQDIQAQVQQQVAAAKAQITQGYASRGMSSNPQQNSALAQDLANVDTQAQALQGSLEQQLATAGNQMVQTANNLLQTGLQGTNISAQIPIYMQQLNIQLAQATSQAIASFSAAINGGAKLGGTTINLPAGTTVT